MDTQRNGCFPGHKTAIWLEMDLHTFDFDKELWQATTVFCLYVYLKVAWLVFCLVYLFFRAELPRSCFVNTSLQLLTKWSVSPQQLTCVVIPSSLVTSHKSFIISLLILGLIFHLFVETQPKIIFVFNNPRPLSMCMSRFEHCKPTKNEESPTSQALLLPSAMLVGPSDPEPTGSTAPGLSVKDWANAAEFVPGQPYCGRGESDLITSG